MTIYIDIFFLKNLFFNFILIYLTSVLIRKKIKICRIVIAASVGAVYALIALKNSLVFNSLILKVLTSILMLIISFGSKEVLAVLSSFLVLAYLFAGVMASLLNTSSCIIAMIFSISMIIIFYVYKKHRKYNEYYELYLKILEYDIKLTAKLDTGNELSDSIFGEPVIVVSEENVKEKLDNELIKILNNKKIEISEKYKKRIRIISFKTISDEGMKLGIKLDKVLIKLKEKNIESNAVMIITNKKFIGYDALIGQKILEGGFESEDNSINKIKIKRTI